LWELLDMIEGLNQAACKNILLDNRKLFATVQGSTNNHQAWPGGYQDHVCEIMNIAHSLYLHLSSLRSLPFSLSDLLLVVFLHDIEKPWKYELRRDGQLYHRSGLDTKTQHHQFRMQKLAEYGISLTPEQLNGLQYVEGELGDYTNRRRMMGPLAAVAHMCDTASARLWFDHPLVAHDPWEGARRTHS
jgi:hypothetical protein